MTPEQKFELLDQYLSGKLSTEEIAAFEEQLKTDVELQKELKFQKEVIEGIRQARIAELKAMLNNVPVPPASSFTSGVAAKIIGSVVVVGSISTALYFYFSSDNNNELPTPVEQVTPQEKDSGQISDNIQPAQPAETPPVTTIPENKPEETKKKVTPSKSEPLTQPQLQVFTPVDEEIREQIEKEHRHLEIVEKGFVTSSIEVVTNNDDKKYSFHYAFQNRKLVLYGNFEDNLYEILEFISGNERTVVLYYKSYYYLLDTDKEEPTPLVPIRDKALLTKLKQFRKK
ncbi:MAG: hypothetical protein NZM13_08000 [Cyclobacteriaceae bacterium]|nr:hypothetical protein [Cyclobacteriaceae bacterium]